MIAAHWSKETSQVCMTYVLRVDGFQNYDLKKGQTNLTGQNWSKLLCQEELLNHQTDKVGSSKFKSCTMHMAKV